MTGKAIRIDRLFKSSRLFVVPMDHGVSAGPIPGLKDIRQTVKQVVEGGADAIIVHKGLVGTIFPLLSRSRTELIIHLSASTSLAPDANCKELVASVEHALRLGATAVSVHINLAAAGETAMLKDLGQVAEDCDRWGVPLLAMMYVRDGRKESEFDPDKIKHAARVAEELGADIIKINYTGAVETFEDVVRSVKVPIIIAGGPRLESTLDLLTMIHDAVQAGARGVAIGRNVFQHPRPLQLSQVIRRLLDENPPRPALPKLAALADAR